MSNAESIVSFAANVLMGGVFPQPSGMLYRKNLSVEEMRLRPLLGLGGEYVLEPVAIGTPLAEAPLQTTELLNVGEAMASYRVEGHGIKRANNSQGYGMQVSALLRAAASHDASWCNS